MLNLPSPKAIDALQQFQAAFSNVRTPSPWLKKKIIEGNFSEPKSLFKNIDLGSGSSMKNKLRQHAFDYSQKKILSDSKTTSKMDQSNIYDLNLETVQERVYDKSCLTLDVSDLVGKGRDCLLYTSPSPRDRG